MAILFVLSMVISNAFAEDATRDNVELEQIYEADQKDRDGPPSEAAAWDWKTIGPRDSERRKRVRELIDEGHLSTGRDYERAAMVFQHGETSDDILLAHVLAVTAIGKGNMDARWLAAATLDRFLWRIGQPQVFGTNFSHKQVSADGKWTMDPYDRFLIAPGVREANCVPDQKRQAATLDALSRGERPKPSNSCGDTRGRR
jgi:hypothetical protein